MIRFLIAACVGFTLNGPAQAYEDFNRERELFFREQFDGWGGIVFQCLYDSKSDFGRGVCENATTDARFLAAAGKVPFHAVESQEYFAAALASRRTIPNALILEASVRTSAVSGLVGVHLRLQAGNFYSKAVDKGEAEGPKAIPRGGTLVLWDRDATASGYVGSELENAIKNAFDSMLKDFFSLFLEHWQNPTERK